MADYSTLLDDETRAFVARTQSFDPPHDPRLSVATRRAACDRMCRAFHVPYPPGLSAQTTALEVEGRAIPIRRYLPSKPHSPVLVVYFHGGGFVLGGLDSHDAICAEIAEGSGYELVAVDYRLAPEHLHPAAFEDALAAFRRLRDEGRPAVLCGDSAGANLAAAVAHATRGEQTAIGQVLIYPVLGGKLEKPSFVEHAEAPLLTAQDIVRSQKLRAGDRDAASDASFAPLADRDFSRLPPTVIVSAECDPLSSDGEAYRDALVAAGGLAVWFNERGMVHGYLRARHTVRRGGNSFSRIVDAVRELGQGQWPY